MDNLNDRIAALEAKVERLEGAVGIKTKHRVLDMHDEFTAKFNIDQIADDLVALRGELRNIDAKLDMLVADLRKELRNSFQSATASIVFQIQALGNRVVEKLIDHNDRLNKAGL